MFSKYDIYGECNEQVRKKNFSRVPERRESTASSGTRKQCHRTEPCMEIRHMRLKGFIKGTLLGPCQSGFLEFGSAVELLVNHIIQMLTQYFYKGTQKLACPTVSQGMLILLVQRPLFKQKVCKLCLMFWALESKKVPIKGIFLQKDDMIFQLQKKHSNCCVN